MTTLILIPARKNSKGLPGKNIKKLGGKPLIQYSLEFALSIKKMNDEICVSTDDENIVSICENLGINVPFLRPNELATDTATTFSVIDHALEYFSINGKLFDRLLLLQPTSPFRIIDDYLNVLQLFNDNNPDMVVSTKISKDSPFFNLFIENESGYLENIVDGKSFTNRQECPPVYSYNGSIYYLNLNSYKLINSFQFKKVIKYIMPDKRSVDIDTPLDWKIAEFYLHEHNENN